MTDGGKRDLVSIDDLGNDEILALFERADRFQENLKAWSALCPGSILATLFFEPSTRTRLSFESAMLRLGGGVISATQGPMTSAAKGESLADTARVVGGRYADLIVLRHGDEGAARVVARFAEVPVVNAGDGAHEHPTQTLCDLYTLWREKGSLEGLEVVLCGDLKYSRTIHSFAYALARFGGRIACVPFPGMEIPDHVLRRLERRWGARVERVGIGDLKGLVPRQDAIYITPGKPHQQSLFLGREDLRPEHIDAVYMTRSQRERHGEEDLDEGYPSLGPRTLSEGPLKEARVMHPLPRVDEISYDLDRDPRALYFRQAALGVPIRMALLAFLLGKIELGVPAFRPERPAVYLSDLGIRCRNPKCITVREGRRYLSPEFWILEDLPPLLQCVFCGWEERPLFVAHKESRILHRGNSPEARRIRPDRRVYFLDPESAREAGFGRETETV